MPNGPRGEKLPADVIGNAVVVARIATGEADESFVDDDRDKAAVALGRQGRKSRTDRFTIEQRFEIARNTARKRKSSKRCEIKGQHGMVLLALGVAEAVGFEPTGPSQSGGFKDCCNRPLCHASRKGSPRADPATVRRGMRVGPSLLRPGRG